MIGLASMMRSPSTFRITRSTPWVDGCWGPKLISISCTSNIVPGSWFVVGRTLRTTNYELRTSRFRDQLLQHVLRFRLARHAEREVFRLAFGDRLRVAFAVPTARRAVGLRHRREQLVLERPGLGQLHALGQSFVGVVPRRFGRGLGGLSDNLRQLRRGR